MFSMNLIASGGMYRILLVLMIVVFCCLAGLSWVESHFSPVHLILGIHGHPWSTHRADPI